MSKEEILASFEAKVEALRKELKETMTQMISLKMGGLFKELLAQYGITEGVAHIQWNYYPEGDDEGGTIWYPESIELFIDGNYIDGNDYVVKRKAKYSDGIYDYDLAEDLNDALNDIKSLLYEADVTEITVDLEAEEN